MENIDNGVLIYSEAHNYWVKAFGCRLCKVTDEYIDQIKNRQDNLLKGVGIK